MGSPPPETPAELWRRVDEAGREMRNLARLSLLYLFCLFCAAAFGVIAAIW